MGDAVDDVKAVNDVKASADPNRRGPSVNDATMIGLAIPEQPTTTPVDIVTTPAPPPAPARSGQTIAAVERALDVLLLFGEDGHEDLGVTEVASLLHMSKAAVHRVLSSLRTRGLVTLDPGTHRYSLGAASLALGRAYLDRLDIRGLAAVQLTDLSEQTDESALLSVASRRHLLFVDQVLPERSVRLETPIGHPIPLHTSAAGQVLLAARTPGELDDYVAHALDDASFGLDDGDVAPLLVELALISDRGWAVADDERHPGFRFVSVALQDHRRTTVGSLSVAGPIERIEQQQDVIITNLVDAGHSVSASMGWSPFEDDESDLLA